MKKLKFLLTMLFAWMGMISAFAGIGDQLDRSGYAAYASSACDDNQPSGQVECVLDGQSGTYWHSNWGGGHSYGVGKVADGVTQFLVIDRGTDTTPLGGFGYIPRQGNGVQNGAVQAWKLFVTDENPLTDITDTKQGVTNESDSWTQVTTGTFNVTAENSNNAYVYVMPFNASANGRYVIFEVTQGLASYATVAEFYLYGYIASVYKDNLNNAIAAATAKNTSEWQSSNVGFYRDLTSAIATAQAVYDDADASQEAVNAAENALNTAVEQAFIMPEADKYYYIRSGLKAFYNQQGVYKAMYANGNNNAWKTIDNIDLNFIWTWVPKADGWVVRNVGTGKYLNTVNEMSDSEPSGTIKLTFLNAAGEFNIKATGGAVMHANGHSNGAGQGSNIIQWGGDAGSASSWMLVEVTDEVMAAANARKDLSSIVAEANEALVTETYTSSTNLITNANQLATNAGHNELGNDVDGGGISALVDGNTTSDSFFHSSYGGQTTTNPNHLLQIDLGDEAPSYVQIKMWQRNGNNRPSTVEVWGTNNASLAALAEGKNYTTVDYNQSAWNAGWTRLTTITVDNSANPGVMNLVKCDGNRYIRLNVTATNTGTKFFTMSEIRVYAHNADLAGKIEAAVAVLNSGSTNVADYEAATASLNSVMLAPRRAILQQAINAATEKNAAPWQGVNPGYYSSLTSAISAAQAVYDNASATGEQISAATTTLNTAVEQAFIMPEAGKYYYIISSMQAYHNQQGVYKGMYDNNGSNKWNTVDYVDFNYLWTWAPKADGWVVRNVGTGKYLNTVNTMSDSEPGGTIKLTFLNAAGEFNIKATGGAVMHTEGHNEGAGSEGNIVNWSGAANSASSWTLVETTLSNIADLLIQQANKFIENATVGTQLGQTPQSAINAINAAIATLSGSEKTMEDINTFNTAVAEAKNQSIWPVFTINSVIDYGEGKSIYEDASGAQNHFKATDGFDYRHLWVFEGLKSSEMAVGTYVIKNAVTGNVLHCGSANNHYTVRHTGSSNDDTESGQWLIYPNETSGTASQVHAQNAGSLIVTWNNANAGSGSCWTLNYLGTTAEIAANADAFVAYQTLITKENEAATMANGLNTPAPGYYAEETEGALAAARAAYAALDRSAIANIATADVDAMVTAYTSALAQCTIQMPTAGFYRIKGGTSSKYMTSNTSSGCMNLEDLSDDNAKQAIWYLNADNKLVSYAVGLGIVNTHTLASVGDNIHTWTFEHAEQGVPYLNLKSDYSGSKYLCDRTNNVTDRMPEANSARTHWIVEPVTSLPVTINAHGFATLNLPVAAEIPAGVTAWYAAWVADDVVTLKKIEGTLPANTAVILHGAENAALSFAISNEEPAAVANELCGTVETIARNGETVLVLGVANDVPGLYNYTGANITGFKAYLPYSGSANVRIVWGDVETAIEAVENTSLKEGVMYNLNGQRVQKVNGIVIVNGKKIVVK